MNASIICDVLHGELTYLLDVDGVERRPKTEFDSNRGTAKIGLSSVFRFSGLGRHLE